MLKLSKKLKNRIKKRLLACMSSISIVLMLLAGSKLAGLSAPLGIAKLSAKADEVQALDEITTVTVAEDGAIVCESIVQGVRDCNLSDGNYVFRVTGNAGGIEETKDYAVELINYYDDVTYSLADGETSKTVSLGDSTTDYKMLVVKYHGNLSIDAGVTVTATHVSNLTYKKGMYLCVMGQLKNKGTISMTARGTYNQAGENVYLWKNIDNTFEYVPAVGGTGGAGVSMRIGNAGGNGTSRGTGGGGSGGSTGTSAKRGGNGSAGTSYSGGSGGGGAYHCAGAGTYTGGDAGANGGAGGTGSARTNSSSNKSYASGGAGNLAGAGAYRTSSGNAYGNAGTYAQNGTGGLLTIYADSLCNIGTISSNGSSVAGKRYSSTTRYAGGGASGGGSINLFVRETIAKGTIQANGGTSTVNTSGITYAIAGSNGGAGTVTYTELYADLNYEEKSLELNIGNNYTIQRSKFIYLDQNGIQTNAVTLGTLSYESLDTNIATVDSNGKITAKAQGSTKIKLTDTTHNLSTYLFLEVIDNVKIDVQEGKNFTAALKQNGTVWTYGLNTNGELGTGDNENKLEPTQVSGLSNVKQIASGYSHTLALLENGEVYSWGLGTNGQLGNGSDQNSNVPVKVDGISNIVKIDAYKNISIALDKDGKVYVWGQGYSTLPMKVVFSETVIDISGTLMLTNKGRVYSITNTTNEIAGLSNIARISCGEAHNLALSTHGMVFAWGTNTYGECGIAAAQAVSVRGIIDGISDISAGNCVSILKSEDEKIYALGNNASGQIGLGTTAKATALTQISVDREIESISAGEGTHSSLIGKDGFVLNTGLNTYGELGTGNTTNKNTYSQIGKTIITTNYEQKYLDINESVTITAILENTFNLKIDIIDDNQDNFNITLTDNDNLSLNNKTITALDYCTATATVSHNVETVIKDIKIIVAMKMESIVQGFRDIDLADGEYSVVVNDQAYTVELINYYDDMVYTENTELGDETTEYKTLVVKYHKDLTVNTGVTLTAKTVNNLTYKKGMYICVLGDIHNNGTISMTARGTYNQAGEDVFLWKNINSTYEYVPSAGGSGGLGYSNTTGTAGTAGTNRSTGGGGAGGSAGTNPKRGGNGSAGTSYSGGSGGGGAYHCAAAGTYAGGDAGINGGAGGTGSARTNSSSNKSYASGGAGNLAGAGAYRTSSGNTFGGAGTFAQNGTGGLLTIYADNLYNEGTISSNGSNVIGTRYASTTRYAGGGASGGGSVNIFANFVNVKGNIQASGGISTVTKSGMKYYRAGANGGNGTVTINELGSVLNYSEKSISLNIQETYTINKTGITYTKLNEIQTEDLNVGTLTFEPLNEEIAIVDASGKITAVGLGKTKIKITDLTNGYSTYIIVNVTKIGLVAPKVQEGTDFTVALKANGTVWTYGSNANGQLGINSMVASNEPVEVTALENIVEIGAGSASAIALTESGEVYTWGRYTYKDEVGATQTTNRLLPVRENLERIIKVDSYGNNFYAIDSEGIAYIWGEGYSMPTVISTDKKMADVSGRLLLGQDGLVYLVSNPTVAINYISNICEIACGQDHYLFLTLNGEVFGLQANEIGQLGNGTYNNATTPTLVKTSEGYLNNVASISAGYKTSMAVTYSGEAYAWGDNTNKKLGITEAKTAYATQIIALQDKEGNELPLVEMEIVEAGTNHSTISDKYGFVYSVGLNASGQLGTEDNNARTIFTKIGRIEITTNPAELEIPVNTTQEISVILSNTFNLKGDIAEEGKVDLQNTNEKEITVEKIEGADNSETTNIDNFVPNYRVTGNKIGRVVLVATSKDGHEKNIWLEVVNNDQAEVASKVVNGDKFTITLRSDGTVWSFGQNTNGQLGFGDTVGRNKPEKVELAEEIIDISAGQNHVLLLGKSGKVYSMGLNANGQLGTGNTTTYKVPTVLSIGNIAKVVASGNTSFAITNEGKVYSWGEGYTKLPTILSITQTVETGEVDEEGNAVTKVEDINVIDVSKNYYLSSEGTLRKLADHTEILLSLNQYDVTEVPVIEEDKIVQISEGTDHLIALGESGKVYTYGTNTYGQLGDKTTVSRNSNITTAVQIEDGSILENIVEISAGDKYGLAVSKDGKVYTWGINGEQQLGFSSKLEEGGIQESGYALLKEDISNVERVSAGYVHTAVYKEDGNVYTWGQGTEGELGNGKSSNYYEPQLVGKNIVETNTNEILLEEEQTFDIDGVVNYFNLFEEKQTTIKYEVLDGTLALINSTTGEVMAIKAGRTAVLAREENTDKIGVVNLRILPKGTKPETTSILVEPVVETDGNHTIMLKANGTVWSYGLNEYGELGNGSKEYSDEPVQAIFPKGTVITKIATGENHSLALDSEGNVWSWGRNNYYQLGNIKTAEVLTPTKVSGLSNIKDIACGSYTSFAITETGELYSFGLNANGECGIGSYTNKITVTKAKYVTDAIDVKAGKNHTMILTSTGEVYVTGSNLYGELGRSASLRKTNLFTKVESLSNVIRIASGDSNNTVVKLDGSVYSWGSNIYKELGVANTGIAINEPMKVQGLSDIRYIDGGKGYNLAINSNNEIYVNGLNSNGELGDSTQNNVIGYTKLGTINNVMQMSAGNGYTAMLKTDGTVWACGDYTGGDENIKSKTKSSIPVQVGNDETGLGQTQITIKVNSSKEIAANCAYAFNLIYLEENFTDSLTYETLNEQIATVDEQGLVTGVKVGTTRVNAVSSIDGKTHSVLVNVVTEDSEFAPKVESGENFVAVLKADGSLWSFGYNSDGRLGVGNNLVKDVPTKTNILATYEDIQAGKDFIIALRSDGSVWSVGNNRNGQLGNGTTTRLNKFAQIGGLEDIKQIAAGENFGLAIDSLGIVYGWGNNNRGQLGSQNIGNDILKPIIIPTTNERIIDISAGKEQSVFVTAKGNVWGYGNILNTTLEGITNAIKAEVTENSIVILTSAGEVYEYKNGTLSQITLPNKVIDMKATSDTVMYQTVDEKTYVTGTNTYGELGTGDTNSVQTPTLVNVHGESTYAIGAGYNNTYIIENTGNVYAAGNNEYGSIGNGTREAELEHILVGDRFFEVEPQTATMNVGDTEEVTITGEPFNVFGANEISSDEYNWVTDNDTIVTAQDGTLTAEAQGTAHITITDKVTGESVSLTRIVVEPDSDRIAKITVNNVLAELDETSTEDDIKYKVQVVTNENTGVLNITTKNGTDRISIDGGQTWSYNGTLNQEIDLSNKITEVPITVSIQNNNGEYVVELNYTLTVEKITDDIGIKEITVSQTDSAGTEGTANAVPVGLTRYEVAVDEATEVSLTKVVANSEYSFVSIDGLEYTLAEQTEEITLGNDLSKQVQIVIKSEAGTEVEYTLVIYRKNELMNLSSLTVNGKEAEKASEGTYAVTVPKETTIGEITAEVASNLASISIANNNYAVKTNTETIDIESDTTVVTIRVKVDEAVKEYTLYIYRQTETNLTPKIDMLMVNGNVLTAESDGKTYIAYLPSTETGATIRVIAEESTTNIKIADNEEEQGDSEAEVQIPNGENTYTVVLTDTEGNTVEYTVIIRKAESDASIGRIYVSNGDTDIDARIQDDGSYLVKIPNNYEDVDVTAIAGYAKAKVQVAETGNYVVYRDTQNVTVENEETVVKIKVQSEDGTSETEYILNIVKLSGNKGLAKVEVDGVGAVLGEDGKYHYTLTDAISNVSVKAVTEAISPTEAWVKIDNTQYALYEITKQVDITAKETAVPIRVKAEDGSVQTYTLIIEGLPDDTNINTVTVNGMQATYLDGQNRYEVRSDAQQFTVEVVLSDLLASMVLGDNPVAIGTDSITVTKTGAETVVKVKVTSQNGLEEQEYTIAILEKSNNVNLDTLMVNGNIVNPSLDGSYRATVKNSTMSIEVVATAEDEFATTTINAMQNLTHTATITESVVSGKTIYTYEVKVVAEDGTEAEYVLEVEQLEANTKVAKVLVGKEEISLEDATLKQDGTYYYKIERVDTAYVSVELESAKSTAKVNGETDAVVAVQLPDEINMIEIEAIGEDETSKTYTLIIEKQSNDVTVKSITGASVLETEIEEDMASIEVDEDITTVDLTITLNDDLANLKLAEELEYELNTITRTIDLSSYATEGVVTVVLNIKAEDGTEKEYTISIYKRANVDLGSVTVNTEVAEYDETLARYDKKVANGNKPQVVITASNILQTVQLLDLDENVLATGVGSVSKILTLSTTELTDKYIIKVISHNGEEYGVEQYNLWITQKSKETGITYIKVDSLGTSVSDTTYSSTVAGKEKYPVEIKLKDENAKVRVEDLSGNILIFNQTGTLTGELEIADGETKEFKVIVTSENGEEKEYTLKIERISSNLEIESITVTDYDTDGTTIITKPVENYNGNIYRIVVSRYLDISDVTINAKSSFTDIIADTIYNGDGTLTFTKQLTGLGINEVKIELTAADGTKETKYLQIVQLSDEIGIQNVYVDGTEILANAAGDYEHTVTDEVNLSEVKVILPVATSKVSINNSTSVLQENTVNVSKGGNRQLLIPIKVTAEDGTTYTYTLTLNIISHDTSVKSVKVEGVEANFEEEQYIAYFDKNLTQVAVEVTAGVAYSTVTHQNDDGTEVSGVEVLNFTIDTSDLSQEVYNTTFKVIAEDKAEKEYNLKCIRKSDDNTIKMVHVDDVEIAPNNGNPDYADGTYYVRTINNKAKVKVEANNEFAQVSFSGKTGLQVLEQNITLSGTEKVTQIPVTITSQQGSVYETVIYIEKISDNNKLVSVKVNSELAEEGQNENSYLSYIYDSLTKVSVEIKAENEYANIIRTTENGETWLDENGLSRQAQGTLTMNVDTLENVTVVYFKIVAENGAESPIYTLQIEKMSTDATLKEVYVNGLLIEPNEEGKYIADVLDTVETPLVKAVTNHDKAHVRVMLGEEYLHIAQQSITMSDGRQTLVPITVRSQSGITKVTYLYINKISTSVGLDTVTLNDNLPNAYIQTSNTYRFVIDQVQTDFELFVLAESDYTSLEYEGVEYEASFKTLINVDTSLEGKTVTFKAKSESGAEQIYTVEIARASDNTNLEYLKVEDVERFPDEEGGDTYTVTIPAASKSILIEVKTEDTYANVRLGDNQIMTGYDRGELDISDITQDRIVVPIVVTAVDGTTVRTYNLVLIRVKNMITGKVITQNAAGEHIATVKAYKTSDTRDIDDEIDPREVIAQVSTDETGMYSIQVPTTEEYDIVIEKLGYLSTTITNITPEYGETVEVQEVELLAGDVAVTGEIEIDDLVALTDNYGEITEANKEEKSIYDLNEDGTVDSLDRNILKENYGKVAKKEVWVNAVTTFMLQRNSEETTEESTEELILPMACEYVVTSEYGTRTHPVTGEVKKHTGIDISGEHHTQILAVASGEVTYAGVQNGFGNCVEIKHIVNGETIYSFYAHLSRIDVEVGEEVAQGATIGLEGGDPDSDPNPGSSTGHHLHFEIRTASGYGNDVDPTGYIEF